MWLATSQRGEKIRKSARGVPGTEEGTVKTQTVGEGRLESCITQKMRVGRTDARVNVVDGDAAHVDETVEVVLVWRIVSVPCNHVLEAKKFFRQSQRSGFGGMTYERRMLLRALMQLS